MNDAQAAALAWLKATYPLVFKGQPKPLAYGVHEALLADPRREVSGNALRLVLRGWVRQTKYLKALARQGAQRHALDGSPVQRVSRVEAQAASATLAKYRRQAFARKVARERAERGAPVRQRAFSGVGGR